MNATEAVARTKTAQATQVEEAIDRIHKLIEESVEEGVCGAGDFVRPSIHGPVAGYFRDLGFEVEILQLGLRIRWGPESAKEPDPPQANRSPMFLAWVVFVIVCALAAATAFIAYLK